MSMCIAKLAVLCSVKQEHWLVIHQTLLPCSKVERLMSMAIMESSSSRDKKHDERI